MLPVFSGIRIAHLLLLICMYYFCNLTFFVVFVCFPCLFLSLDYIHLIPARILVPFITLCIYAAYVLHEMLVMCFLFVLHGYGQKSFEARHIRISNIEQVV